MSNKGKQIIPPGLVTVIGPAAERMWTQWGWLLFEQWCTKEAERMNNTFYTGKPPVRVHRMGKQCCIVRGNGEVKV